MPSSQALNVLRLIPSNAAVRSSFSFASLAYRANAFKTSSVVISGGRVLERIGAVIVHLADLRSRLFIHALALFSKLLDEPATYLFHLLRREE